MASPKLFSLSVKKDTPSCKTSAIDAGSGIGVSPTTAVWALIEDRNRGR